jgi:hypothetical protein
MNGLFLDHGKIRELIRAIRVIGELIPFFLRRETIPEKVAEEFKKAAEVMYNFSLCLDKALQWREKLDSGQVYSISASKLPDYIEQDLVAEIYQWFAELNGGDEDMYQMGVEKRRGNISLWGRAIKMPEHLSWSDKEDLLAIESLLWPAVHKLLHSA